MAPRNVKLDLQERILDELGALKNTVDELKVNAVEMSSDMKSLRKELGVDGNHGRLPLLEAKVEKLEVRIGLLEVDQIHVQARNRIIHSAIALLGGGLGGTLITLLARALGLR